MEDVKEKHPSLPTNYVSLVQLQERWKKEQVRKKQAEEEEEERKQRENQEQELKRGKVVGNGEGNLRRFYGNRKSVKSNVGEKHVVKKKGEIGEGKTPSGSVTNNHRRFRRNRMSAESKSVNVGEKLKDNENRREIANGRRKIESASNLIAERSQNGEVGVQKVEAAYNRSSEESQNEKVRVQKVEAPLNSSSMESQSEKVTVQDQQSGLLKKEKRRKKRNRKSRRDENLTGGKELDDKDPVAVIKGNEEEKKIPVATVRSEYPPKNQIPVGIGWKFANLSINGVREGNVRYQRKYYRDFGRRKGDMERESGLMWVKKGDNVAGGAAI